MSRPSRPRRRALRAMLAGSLVLHAAVVAVLLVSLPERPRPESPEASSFEIVTDGGAANAISPGQERAPPAAKPGADMSAPESNPTLEPPRAPEPLPPTPEPAPLQAAPSDLAPEPNPPEVMPPEPAPSEPSLPVPTARPAPRVDLALPPLPDAPPSLEPLAPLPPLPQPPTPRLRPQQLARPLPRPAPRNPFGFPAPQDWSFSGGTTSHSAQSGASGRMELAGPSLPKPRVVGADLGRDWLAELYAWAHARGYYPEQAVMNNEEGNGEVVFTVNRFGKVLSVEMVTRTGSQWLDLEMLGLFRGAHVPPFPANIKEDVATIYQPFHFGLIR